LPEGINMQARPSLLAGFLTLAATLTLCAHAVAACTTATHGAVFFVTDREPLDDDQLFSGERGQDPSGNAIVSTGSVSSPPSKANAQTCASMAEFLRAVGGSFVPKKPRQVLIYIHGYYTAFGTAAENAMALQKTLRFAGPVIVYSWPSKKTSRLAYSTDENNAAWSLPHLDVFLGQVVKAFPGMPISFAAHSLGSRFAAGGMDFLHRNGCNNCFGRAAFYAPDMDTFALVQTLQAANLCKGRPPERPLASAPAVLYVSNTDRALRQSEKYHGRARAGQAAGEMIICAGVDTIDVSYYKSSDSAGHSYMTDVPVVEDTAAAFAGVPPTSHRRNLRPATRDAGVYYELRPPGRR
jgi:esterase/lipase superfamily enzyme